MPDKKKIELPVKMVPKRKNRGKLLPEIAALPHGSIPTTVLIQVPEKGRTTCSWKAYSPIRTPISKYILEKSEGWSDGWIGDPWNPCDVLGQRNLVLFHIQGIPQLKVTEESYYHELDPDMHWRVLQPCIESLLVNHKPGTRHHLIVPTAYYLCHQRQHRLHGFLLQSPGLTFSVATAGTANVLASKNWRDRAQRRSRSPYRYRCCPQYR